MFWSNAWNDIFRWNLPWVISLNNALLWTLIRIEINLSSYVSIDVFICINRQILKSRKLRTHLFKAFLTLITWSWGKDSFNTFLQSLPLLLLTLHAFHTMSLVIKWNALNWCSHRPFYVIFIIFPDVKFCLSLIKDLFKRFSFSLMNIILLINRLWSWT